MVTQQTLTLLCVGSIPTTPANYKERKLIIMTESSLKDRLIKDLRLLFIPVDEVDFEIRPYSKSFYGKYYPKSKKYEKPRMWVYPYMNKCGTMYPYETVLLHAIHEACHHVQYSDPEYTRRKGIMHNATFFKFMNKYVNRAKKMHLLSEEVADVK